MPKPSRLAEEKSGPGFKCCFYHLKAGLSCPAFKWSTSLDLFINKGHKKYFIHDKTV
jgi:hypothetical protein